MFGGVTSRMEENTVNICLCVLKVKNKNSHDSYWVRNLPLFDSVTRLKAYLLERCKEKLEPKAKSKFVISAKSYRTSRQLQNNDTEKKLY